MKSIDVVAAIILNKGKEVLLAQRPLGKDMAGMWEFPGGKIEATESEEDAVHRELEEELGLKVTILSRLGTFTHRYEWGEVRLIVFIVEALNEPRATQDVQVFRWETLDSVDLNDLTPADRAPWTMFLTQ